MYKFILLFFQVFLFVSVAGAGDDCLGYKLTPDVSVRVPMWEKNVVQPLQKMDVLHGNVIATMVDNYEINTNISSPQQYHEIIKTRGNYSPIDIINNEAISAANYKNQISLVYATVDPGHITLLVKNQNKGLNQEVGNYVMGLFK